MVTTNLTTMLPDIKEVVNLFGNEKDFNIEHFFSENDTHYLHSVTFSPLTVS